MTARHEFLIGGHGVRILFADGQGNDMRLLPSFANFSTHGLTDCLLQVTVDDTLRPIAKQQRERIRTFDTGNGDIVVDKVADGGYQYIIKDLNGRECALLETNGDFSSCRCALNGSFTMRSFGLNNALMLAYAFAASHRRTILIHASLVRRNGKGYPFIAKSGTGKSTHSSLWLRYLPGCDLMNDDNPIVRILDDGTPYIYGSPWSGKTPCYRNVSAPLGAVTRIDRAPANSIERLNPVEAFASLLPACSSMKWDKEVFDGICNTVTKVIETTPIFTLHCLPDEEAAQLCCKTITSASL